MMFWFPLLFFILMAFAAELHDENWAMWTIHIHPEKTNMTMENQPFEDVSPTKNGGFLLTC